MAVYNTSLQKRINKKEEMINVLGNLFIGFLHENSSPVMQLVYGLQNLNTKSKVKKDLLDAAMHIEKSIQQTRDLINTRSISHFSISNEIKEAIECVRFRVRYSNINLEVNLQDQDIKGYNLVLRQVLVVMLLNSIDAIDASNGSVKSITLKSFRKARRYIIEIEDTGCGIKDVGALFKTFKKKKGNNSKSIGLGLYYAKSSIEDDFNGKLNVISKVGKGTKITITLPI